MPITPLGGSARHPAGDVQEVKCSRPGGDEPLERGPVVGNQEIAHSNPKALYASLRRVSHSVHVREERILESICALPVRSRATAPTVRPASCPPRRRPLRSSASVSVGALLLAAWIVDATVPLEALDSSCGSSVRLCPVHPPIRLTLNGEVCWIWW